MKKFATFITALAFMGLLVGCSARTTNNDPGTPDPTQNTPSDPSNITNTLKKIEITTLPTKLTYTVNETFDPSGMVVTATYKDNSSTIVANNKCTFTYDFSSAGEKEVTVTYEGKMAGFMVTVTSGGTPGPTGTVHPTGVSLNLHNLTFTVGGPAQTLSATVTPDSATNKNVTWSSSNSNVASVSNGVVTPGVNGTATITVSTVDGGLNDYCSVTVNKASTTTTYPLINSTSELRVGDKYVLACNTQGAVAGALDNQILGKVDATFSSDKSTLSSKPSDALVLTLGGTSGAYTLANDDGVLLGATANKKLAWGSGTTTWDISISSGSATIENGTESYGTFLYNKNSPRFTTYTSSPSASMIIPNLYKVGDSTPVDPTNISLNFSELEIPVGGKKTLTVDYEPSNANRNLGVTWESNNTAVATVSDGLVQVKDTAHAGDTCKITATSTFDSTIKASCNITVTAYIEPEWTILMYICGADLESGAEYNEYTGAVTGYYPDTKGGQATADIQEILSVNGQPNDVNIVIETGGAHVWASALGIDANYMQRYHVENKALVKDSEFSKVGMGESTTLSDFVSWGMENYPAKKTGLILWNHGGAMQGVCFDENDNDDGLTSAEVKTALAASGLSSTNKLEFIGYDACLMAVQDIADFNSTYANYMVCAEESEAGTGWDYDSWIDDLYAKKPTETILTAICDGFIADTNALYESENYGPNDQTLSWLDLSKMAAYKTAWESLAQDIGSCISSYNNGTKSKFTTYLKEHIKSYGAYYLSFDDAAYYMSDQYQVDYGEEPYTEAEILQEYPNKLQNSDLPQGYYDFSSGAQRFATFDAMDFLNKIGSVSQFSSLSTKINTAKTKLNDLVGYNAIGALNTYNTKTLSNGLAFFFPVHSNAGTSSYYSSSMTNFSYWRSVVSSYGY